MRSVLKSKHRKTAVISIIHLPVALERGERSGTVVHCTRPLAVNLATYRCFERWIQELYNCQLKFLRFQRRDYFFTTCDFKFLRAQLKTYQHYCLVNIS